MTSKLTAMTKYDREKQKYQALPMLSHMNVQFFPQERQRAPSVPRFLVQVGLPDELRHHALHEAQGHALRGLRVRFNFSHGGVQPLHAPRERLDLNAKSRPITKWHCKVCDPPAPSLNRRN